MHAQILIREKEFRIVQKHIIFYSMFLYEYFVIYYFNAVLFPLDYKRNMRIHEKKTCLTQ